MALYIHSKSDFVYPLEASYVRSGKTNYNEMGLYKLLNYIDFDYKGFGNVEIYLDGELTSTIVLPSQNTRVVQRIYIKLSERIPHVTLQIKILTFDTILTIYNIEFDVDAMERY